MYHPFALVMRPLTDTRGYGPRFVPLSIHRPPSGYW